VGEHMFQGPAYIGVVVHDEDDPVCEVYRFSPPLP
jgi:hypothetical protein